MADIERIQHLIKMVRPQLIEVAKAVRDADAWSMSLPVAVIDARQKPALLTTVGVGSVGNVLPISTTVDHPLIQKLYRLYDDSGAEAAIDEIIHGQEGDAFAEIFDAHQEERAAGPLIWGAGDAAQFVTKSRDCFHDGEVAVAAVMPLNTAHELITFGVPLWALLIDP